MLCRKGQKDAVIVVIMYVSRPSIKIHVTYLDRYCDFLRYLPESRLRGKIRRWCNSFIVAVRLLSVRTKRCYFTSATIVLSLAATTIAFNVYLMPNMLSELPQSLSHLPIDLFEKIVWHGDNFNYINFCERLRHTHLTPISRWYRFLA